MNKLEKDHLRVCREPRGYCVSSFSRAPGNAINNAPLLAPRHFLSETAEDPYIFLHPAQVRFTQDSIKSQFRDGTPLLATVSQLVSSEIEKRDVEMCRIVHHDGAYYTLDNRRLACFRLLEMLGGVRNIKCRVLPMAGMENERPQIRAELARKLDTGGTGSGTISDPNHGKTIRVRGDGGFVIGTDMMTTDLDLEGALDAYGNDHAHSIITDDDAGVFLAHFLGDNV